MSGPGPARRLIERVEGLRRRSPTRAQRALERDFARALRGADPATRGELWRLRGHVLRSLRRLAPAALAYRSAERWYGRARQPREQGRCAIGLVDALMYLSRYGEARRAAARGRRRLERAGDALSAARLLNNEGNLWHRLDLPERALERYRLAQRRLARAGDRGGAALVDVNVANCLSLLGRLEPARRHYARAARAGHQAGREVDALRAEYNLAYLEFLQHRYEPALEALLRLREEARRRGVPSIVALTHLDRAEILLRMGVHEPALAEAAAAAAAAAELGLGYERAKAETFAALAEHRLGQSGSARARLERSLERFHREGNAVWAGEALVGLATLWERDGGPDAAAGLLGAARAHFARAGDREREAAALALLAGVRIRGGRIAQAARTLERLRARLSGHAPSPRLRHLALAAEAGVARARGDFGRARRTLRQAARESERLAARILDEQWRSTFWGEWGWPHLDLATLELEQGRVADALDALEAGRGRALVGPATGRRAAHALPRRVRDWAAGRLLHARERASRSGAPAATTDGALEPRGDPGLTRALGALPPRVVRARTLARALGPDTLLVDYLHHQERLSAITVARGRLRAHPGLAGDALLGPLAHALLFALRGAAFRTDRRADDRRLGEALAELASLVLWPLLEGERGLRALAVAPVQPLQRLPWAALPLADGRRLCEALELTVVPGLRLGLARRAGTSPPCGSPLIVAVDAGELENVEPETRAILERFPEARLVRGREATAACFLEHAPRAPWIHFAGHGHYRPDAPEESGLRFADRWLLASELAGLRLQARWVSLSACQTARALVHPGEEWYGLARALLVAGASAVLASQWDIEDGAAARLMTAVYTRLAAGDGPGAALATAQAERCRGGDHPLDWAGFVVLSGPGQETPNSPGAVGVHATAGSEESLDLRAPRRIETRTVRSTPPRRSS